MRRLLAVVLLLAGTAFANQKWQFDCTQGGGTVTVSGIPSSQDVQLSYPLATVTVYLQGTTTVAQIYSDNLGTPKGNPFTADITGHAYFYAGNGRYDVKCSGTGIASPFTFGDVLLNDFSQATFGIQTVTFSATPSFNALNANMFKMTLTGNVTSSSIINYVQGQPLIFQLTQDGTGSRTFACDPNFVTCPPLNPQPNSTPICSR